MLYSGMIALSTAFALLSAVAHVTWNLLLKRSGNKGVFVWGMLASPSILLVPLGAALLWLSPVNQPGRWIVPKYGLAAIRREWWANAGPMVIAGLLTFPAYGLVLTALTRSKVSYVAPAREWALW